MKKTYMQPLMEVVRVNTSGVLMTSGGVGSTSVRMSWDTEADENEDAL